jgi:spore coat polysaccharide biosynthesis protein SpsF (cytidylyltransferase family)
MDDTAVIVIARMSSSRLINKMNRTLPHGNGRVIEWDIIRANSLGIDTILATSVKPEDDFLHFLARGHTLYTYRGSYNDKLERVLGAAKTYRKKYVTLFDGDDLFCAPELLEASLKLIKFTNVDCIKAPENIVVGGFTYTFSTLGLERMNEIKESNNTEMAFDFLIKKAELKVLTLPCLPIYINNSMRLTLDYEEDLLFFEDAIMKYSIDPALPLYNILNLIKDDEELLNINLFRNKDWAENQDRLKS